MDCNQIICFQQDTVERKRFFKAGSFAHPAKMILGLQIYLIEHYTKPGDVILDPMAGSGTILVACALGRNVICVELEQKFIKMQEANWEKIKRLGPMLGYKMGEATILQGDARDLQGLLVDKCIFSPPYAEVKQDDTEKPEGYWEKAGNIGHKTKMTPKNPNNISSLPYGKISAVISSPPYVSGGHHADQTGAWGGQAQALNKEQANYGNTEGQIGKLSYKADAVITSPPYEGINTTGRADSYNGSHGPHSQVQIQDYRESNENIGNLKSDNYLEAMLQVYRQCHRVLKDGGLLCLVTKNFIRDKKIVQLDLDTIKLCETAGFVLKERLKRKLTQQSFWRTIYYKKFPEVEKIEYEDVLIFTKSRGD